MTTIEITLKRGRVEYIDGADTWPCATCGKKLRVGDFAIFGDGGVICLIPIPGHKDGAHRLCRPSDGRTGP